MFKSVFFIFHPVSSGLFRMTERIVSPNSPPHRGQVLAIIVGSTVFFSFFNSLDDLSPPPSFYLTFLVENQAGATLKLITSDNDPPDGFKLEPEHSSVITKELVNPSDLSIHAVVPGAEKTLLVNGQPRIVVAPSKITGDPMVLRVTGKDGKSTLGKVVGEPQGRTSRADLDFRRKKCYFSRTGC